MTIKNDSVDKTPAQFYAECIEKFHKIGFNHNLLKEPKQILVPELYEKGNEVVLQFLQNESLQRQADTPVNYYYRICGLVFQISTVFAERWQYPSAQFSIYNVDIFEPDVMKPVRRIVENEWEITIEEFNDILNEIYQELLNLHEPYWNLNDPRQYTFNAILAVFQLGISITLNSYGL